MGEGLDLVVRGHRLRAERFGSASAPLVVGIHGLSLNLRCFDFLGSRIGGDDLQLVAVDLRGRGHSEVTPPGTYGWEEHALDVLAVAEALGFDRFGVIGQSMGGSVAMKVAELGGAERLDGVVLVDIAGRVDRGVGELIGAVMASTADAHDSMDAYLEAVRSQGLIDEWDTGWEAVYRYGAEVTAGGRVRQRVDAVALAEDRAFGASQAQLVYDRWKHLTMPTLLLRASRELRSGVGFVVPTDDRDAFVRDVPLGQVVEVDANHLTINAHAEAATAISSFFRSLRQS